MESCLMPDFVKEFLKTKDLAPKEWCEMDDASKKAAITKQLETTKTLAEAKVLYQFWKQNYYDALERYEQVIKPFNGLADDRRTYELNKPLTRLHINLTEAYVTGPAYEYQAASAVLRMLESK